MSAAAGPLTGASPINGLTAITYLSAIASRIPLHSRIGVMLVIGFEGPITTTSLASTARRTSSVLSGGTFEQRTTSSIGICPLERTQYSW
jgi:hypothetical protein